MATVTRVLPWRRSHGTPGDGPELAALIATFGERHPKASADGIRDAYSVALAAHGDQARKSGEPYIHHPLAVARIVAGQGLDDVTIMAALLHDSVEDTAVSLDDIEQRFGPDVAKIVDGVTKLDRMSFHTKEEQQAATMRKMLVAMASDLRVLIIKLADRLHNMRTIAALPAFKQERTSHETIDIYAPLAHRLGMQEVKQQLEDLAFSALHPKWYAQIDQMIAERSPERDLYLTQVLADVQARLLELGIDADVTGRPKHLWSIYEKMVLKDKSFADIYDLMGIRVIVGSVKDCYAALGSLHATWKPIQGRFKDYIAMPKFNLYQSLHTTVVGPQGKPLEVQIRTNEMHARAEFGVAAHWEYKERSSSNDLAWLSRIIDWQQEASDPSQFMANLKVDLDQDEVYVFTPKGDIHTLSVGATPVDFAYAIHTEIGHACIGARINAKLSPLDTRLVSGDTVEIFTSKIEGAGPSRDWLKFVATQRAANKIRQWYSRERREDAIEQGRDDLVKAVRREGLPVKTLLTNEALADLATRMNYGDVDTLLAAIGEGHVSAPSVAGRIGRELRAVDPTREAQMSSTVHTSRQSRRDGSSTGVVVEGLGDVLIRLSRCCTPMPPDEIIGFVTRGRGVSVHRSDCANAMTLVDDQGERLIDVEWDDDHTGKFLTAIEVRALDRKGLLADITTVLAEQHVDIVSAGLNTSADRVATMRFEFELADVSHLDHVLARVERIDSVYDAYRVLPGGSEKS